MLPSDRLQDNVKAPDLAKIEPALVKLSEVERGVVYRSKGIIDNCICEGCF